MKEYTQKSSKSNNNKYFGNILVAEDNPANQKLIQVLLSRMNLDVTVVEDGQQAVDLAATESFDLIFMDMHMPLMSGYEATKALRKMKMDIPVIALTANAMKDDERKCLDVGCDAYLSKPVNMVKLNSVLEKYLLANQAEDKRESNQSEMGSQLSAAETAMTEGRGSSLKDIIEWETLSEVCEEEELMQVLGETVHKEIPKYIEKIYSSLQEKDFENIEYFAHTIKGSTASVGANVLAQKAALLEKAGKDKDMVEAQEVIKDIEEDVEKLLDLLSKQNWIDLVKENQE